MLKVALLCQRLLMYLGFSAFLKLLSWKSVPTLPSHQQSKGACFLTIPLTQSFIMQIFNNFLVQIAFVIFQSYYLFVFIFYWIAFEFAYFEGARIFLFLN